jgi:hypothetical protein
MLKLVAGSTPGQFRPDTRAQFINGGIKLLCEELRALPALLAEMSPQQRQQIAAVLMEAQGSFDVFVDQLVGEALDRLEGGTRRIETVGCLCPECAQQP